MAGMILSGDRSLSQDELLQAVAQAVEGFKRLGITNGDRIALLLRNDFAFFIASFAASSLGAFAVPINWHFKEEEIDFILKDCTPKLLVGHSDLLIRAPAILSAGLQVLAVKTPPEICSSYGLDIQACVLPAAFAEQNLSWQSWLAQQPTTTTPQAQAPGTVIYTSGTTGRPKGVYREPAQAGNISALYRIAAASFGLDPETPARAVLTGPLYHSAPNGFASLVASFGGHLVLQSRFNAEKLLALIEKHNVTHLHMVPTMFSRLLKLPKSVRDRYDVSSLTHVSHGAAPCPASVKRAMIEWWGPVVYEYYGSTETGIVTVVNSEDALMRPGTVGRPIPGAMVRVYDENGRVLPAGSVGEIYARIEDYPDFTYGGLTEERRAIERDTLISAGDLGYLDADGYLFLCDRKKDMVISGGVNIYPAEIELVLAQCSGVKDCAVFGIPDEEFGETLCAHIEPDVGHNVSEDTIRSYLCQKLAGYKVPKVIKFTGPLPREDSGKIFKRKLKEAYWPAGGWQI